ncbi:MAG: hypothetical protein AB7G93_15385 [Bdellovibrionales bacterium]
MSGFFIDRRTEEQINHQIETVLPLRKGHPSYPLLMSLNRIVRLLAARSNLLDEKYFRYICDNIGLSSLPPERAVAPIHFTLAKGYDEVLVPKGTRLTTEKNPDVSFETTEDLTARNNTIKSVTIEDHSRSRTWKIAGVNGQITDRIALKDESGSDISYRQVFTVNEKIPKDGFQFLQLKNMKISGARSNFDQFTGLFKFFIDGEEVSPVLFGGLFGSGESERKQGIFNLMGIEEDLAEHEANSAYVYLPIRVSESENFQVEIVNKLNLKGKVITDVDFGSATFFQCSAPAGVVVGEKKIVVGADSKHFNLNPGTSNFLYIGGLESLSTPESSARISIDIKIFHEIFSPVTKDFHAIEVDDKIVALLLEGDLSVSKLEFFDGVFWTAVPGFDTSSVMPGTRDDGTPFLNLEFTIPRIPLSTIQGTEARWLRATVENPIQDNIDNLNAILEKRGLERTPYDYGELLKRFPLIAIGVRIVNIVMEKSVGDQQWGKSVSVGDFDAGQPGNLLRVEHSHIGLFFEFDQVCEDRAVEWCIFVDPQNKDLVQNLKMDWYWKSNAYNWTQITSSEDRTLGLTKSGRIIHPPLKGWYFDDDRKSFILELRLSPGPNGGDPTVEQIRKLVINGVYNNTVEAEGVRTEQDILYFSGTGRPGQAIDLVAKDVLSLSVWIDEPVVHSGESGLRLSRDSKIFEWIRVDNFLSSGPNDRHYVLFHAEGKIQFGNGVKGKSPPVGSKNISIIGLRELSPGVSGVGAGEINAIAKKIPGLKEGQNLLRPTGYRLAVSEDDFYQVAPRKFKHSDRPVTFSDFEHIVIEAFSEVHTCQAFFDTETNRIKIIVVPKKIEDLHTNDSLLTKIDEYLISRSVSNRIKTCYPELRDLKIEITVTEFREDSDVVLAKAKERLWRFFDTVQGGQDRKGWHVGRNIYKSEIAWVLRDIVGETLYAIHLGDESLPYLDMRGAYPNLVEVLVKVKSNGF